MHFPDLLASSVAAGVCWLNKKHNMDPFTRQLVLYVL